MKKTIHRLIILSLLVGIGLTSCVSSKKFNASQDQVNNLEKEWALTQSELNDCKVQVLNLKDEKATLQNDNAMVTNDLKALTIESNVTIAEQSKRLRSLQGIIQSQKSVLQDLKKSIADALMKDRKSVV